MIRNWKLGVITALAIGWSGAALLAEEPAGDKPKDQMLSGPKAEGGEAPQRRFDGERPKHMRGHGGHGQYLRKALGDLGLSDEQKEKIKTIMEEGKAANQQYREEHKAEFESLHEQIKAAREADDKEKLKTLHEQMKALHDGAPVPPKQMIEKVRAELTAEQQAQLDAKLAEVRQKMEERRKEWQEKHPKGGEQGMGESGDKPPRDHKREGEKPADKEKLEL